MTDFLDFLRNALLTMACAAMAIGGRILLWISIFGETKDYTVHSPFGSAPFYVYGMERAIELPEQPKTGKEIVHRNTERLCFGKER